MPLVSSIAWGAFAVIEKYESDQWVRKPTMTRTIFFVPKHHADLHFKNLSFRSHCVGKAR